MEFTVSKSDLVRELSLSQGVVEKKTTIPILSNVLLEASALSLTATDLNWDPLLLPRPRKERGLAPARKLLTTYACCPRAM